MVFKTQKAGSIKGATAPANAASVLPVDAVDKAVAALQDVPGFEAGMVIDYGRAKNAASATAPFTTRAGSLATPGAGAVFVANDANMGNQRVFDMAGMSAVGFPTDAICSASFTMLFPIRIATLRATNHILGVTGSKFMLYIETLGRLAVDTEQGVGEAAHTFTEILFPVNTTRLGWFSHDAATKTSRYGISKAVRQSHVHTLAHAPDGSSQARPYSFYTAQPNSTLIGRMEGWLLLNKAYAADGSAADVAIGKVYDAWSLLVGAAVS